MPAPLLCRAALAVLSVLCVSATPAAAAPAGSALSAPQERVVLRLVDDVCGDTWCEGEHAIRFRSFSCHPRRGCVLRAQLASWSPGPLRWHERSARVPGRRYRDMVVLGSGGDPSLRPAFSAAVGRAVRAMADSVP